MSNRVGVFGWGVVAPKSPNITAFRNNLASADSWLTPFNGFGPDNFLAGTPEFDFADYQSWVGARFAPRHFQRLIDKMDYPSLYAVASFIQALDQNPGIEHVLQELGLRAHVYVGTGLGSLHTIHDASVNLHHAQRRWDRFWSRPENNSALRSYLSESEATRATEVPPHPGPWDESSVAAEEAHEAALRVWSSYWMQRSPELKQYLTELAHIDGLAIEGGIESGKLHAIREKEKSRVRLQEKWQAPEPPWNVSANLIWNIHNTPAAQISILGKITGSAFAPVAACSTFGVALRLAMNAIHSGEAKAVVVGATDPPPHPLTVGSFYNARVLSADRGVSLPLTRFQGTHVAGGAVVWIVGDMAYMESKGFKPLGMEPVGVGVSSDAEHIITPSPEGPKAAMNYALREANALPEDIGTWDVHATATPGDFSEITNLRSIFPESVLVTARKGTFGHGMSAGGGWELTAQYLGYAEKQLFPTPLSRDELNHAIAELHTRFVFDQACKIPEGLSGKLSMGIGGINACVISRPL
ncbi:MAG: beta-ketoacyl synthase N-terminal-like domain-containing protein [Acidobacteriota bacterium]